MHYFLQWNIIKTTFTSVFNHLWIDSFHADYVNNIESFSVIILCVFILHDSTTLTSFLPAAALTHKSNTQPSSMFSKWLMHSFDDHPSSDKVCECISIDSMWNNPTCLWHLQCCRLHYIIHFLWKRNKQSIQYAKNWLVLSDSSTHTAQ